MPSAVVCRRGFTGVSQIYVVFSKLLVSQGMCEPEYSIPGYRMLGYNTLTNYHGDSLLNQHTA